ncbi:hypothetical protein HmCmsJML023_02969 [Escherichia coli]|nr:hypothetical protein HmCmsJML023_02969 [Escherichia coli]
MGGNPAGFCVAGGPASASPGFESRWKERGGGGGGRGGGGGGLWAAAMVLDKSRQQFPPG